MNGLRLTPTRLRRLVAVLAGDVALYGDGHTYHHAEGTRLDAAMSELERAGWVTLAEPSPLYVHKRPWLLTPLGAEVLEKSRRGNP